MKEATTPYSIEMQRIIQLNTKFLVSEGWVIHKEYPLFDEFYHSKNKDLVCTTGLYGEFYIAELHWINKTPEREFSTTNPNLTKEDYFKILDLLVIKY
jgi:hypothetical protein